jgi:hypothetical protein
MAAYNALYSFEQQAKLFQDTINALFQARILAPDPAINPGLNEEEYACLLEKYVQEVEKVLLVEQGVWGQIAKNMKPSDS